MNTAAVFIDLFERILENGIAAVEGLDKDQLAHRPAPDTNSIAWLIWHTARVQDAQVAHLAGTEQVWSTQGWVERFGLPFDPADHGYGHSSDQVGKVRATGDLLAGYLRAVHEATVAYLRGLTDDDLDDVIDTRWDPPVTRGVRLVSIVDDDAQHVGQAAYLRGLLLIWDAPLSMGMGEAPVAGLRWAPRLRRLGGGPRSVSFDARSV